MFEDVSKLSPHIRSIGRNCEFGMIRSDKLNGSDISLLEFAGSAKRDLLAMALRERFARLGDDVLFKGDPPWNSPDQQTWWMVDQTYEITFHTGVPALTPPEDAKHKVVPRLRRLADLLLESILEAEKLFLYSDATLTDPGEALELVSAFRECGPATLLLVLADHSKAGQAETRGSNTIVGYVESLTRSGNATEYNVAAWPQMLSSAFTLWNCSQP